MAVVSDQRALFTDLENKHWNAGTELGDPVFVTYSFLEPSDVPDETVSGNQGYTGFESLDQQARTAMRDAFETLSETAGVTPIEVESDAMIDVYEGRGSDFSLTTFGTFSPDFDNTELPEIIMSDQNRYGDNQYGTEIALHEIGHALGLKHPFEQDPKLAANLDNTDNTVMSYTTVSGPKFDYQNLDEAALTDLYGPPTTPSQEGWEYAMQSDRFILKGSANPDTLKGVSENSRIDGRGGDDEVFGRTGSDTLIGGSGNDRLDSAADSDKLYGGAGSDTIDGGPGTDAVYGQDGDDTIVFDGSDTRIDGGSGHDLVDASDAEFGLFLNFSESSQYMPEMRSVESFRGSREDDVISGDAAANIVYGNLGADELDGVSGSDSVYGNQGMDTVLGNDGADWLFGGQNTDTVTGGNGNDSVYGNMADDILYGDDALDNGDDDLFGGQGDDRIYGQSGDDRIYGNLGDDTLVGGSGADTFAFFRSGSNVIQDFDAQDDILLSTGLLSVENPSKSDLDIKATGSGGSQIDLEGQGSITVRDTAPDQLSDGDFSFF